MTGLLNSAGRIAIRCQDHFLGLAREELPCAVGLQAVSVAAPVGWRRTVDQPARAVVLWPIDQPWPRPGTWARRWRLPRSPSGWPRSRCRRWPATWASKRPRSAKKWMQSFTSLPRRAVAVVVFLTALNSALEELHFRAWLDPELSRRFGNAVGITTSAAAFAGMHLFIFADMRGVTPLAFGLVFGRCSSLPWPGACWRVGPAGSTPPGSRTR